MVSKFGKKELLEKSSALGQSNLILITGIIKTTSIGFGIIVFLNLFLEIGPGWDWNRILNILPFFLLWAVTFLSLLVTYDAAMTSSIYFVHIPRWYEVFLIFLLVGNESILFALLKLSFYSEGSLKETKQVLSVLILNWYFIVFILYCIIILTLIKVGRNAIKKSIAEGRFKPDAIEIVNAFLKDSKKGVLFPILGILVSLISFLTIQFWIKNHNYNCVVYIIFSILIIIISFGALIKLHKERKLLETEYT